MLSASGDLVAGRLQIAASPSSLMMGSGEDSSGGLIGLSNVLGSGCVGKLLSSLQYSSCLFSTSDSLLGGCRSCLVLLFRCSLMNHLYNGSI